MKPEEFEVYVIPPNFMEGGTLFGGLLKTRNTVEAVILGLAVGVPVLHLPFSITVRIVILCLTALPLVLLALIGVSGMSLSAFIRLFFAFCTTAESFHAMGRRAAKTEKRCCPAGRSSGKATAKQKILRSPKAAADFLLI